MKRFHLIAFLLLAVLVLDEALGAYQKSSSESKKLKKTEGEVREAKKKYSESAAKQHKRKVREAPVETEKNTEEIEVKEFQRSRKESKKEDARAEKYNKKGKTKQAGEESYVSQEKKRPKEQEAKSYKKTKQDEKQKTHVVEEVNGDEFIESNEADNEGEENVSCFPEKHNEENKLHVESVPSKKSYCVNKNTVKDELDVMSEDELDVTSVPSKKSNCINRNVMKDETHKEKPAVLQDDTVDENVPARKCYYK